MAASDTAFTVFSGIGFILSIIPLWWHLGSRNVGTCAYMIWTALACLVYFVDSIVWRGNAINRAPVWCDICKFAILFSILCLTEFFLAIRVKLAVVVAWPACSLCIIRKLYYITSTVPITLLEVRHQITSGFIYGLLIALTVPAESP